MKPGFAYPKDLRLQYFAQPRLAGVREACTQLGLDPPIIVTMELTLTGAIDAIKVWIGATPPITAVCAYNDDIALALLVGMRQLGLKAQRSVHYRSR